MIRIEVFSSRKGNQSNAVPPIHTLDEPLSAHLRENTHEPRDGHEIDTAGDSQYVFIDKYRTPDPDCFKNCDNLFVEWWDSNIIPRFTKTFEYSKNF